MVDFKILGTAAGTGVPSFFCECAGCKEAREHPELVRTRTGALISTDKEAILIDTPPDLQRQLVREGIRIIDAVFLTHWHYDHFGGIGELEFYVKLDRGEELPLYLPPSAVESFNAAFPHLTDVFQVVPWEFNVSYCYNETEITPLRANHGIETAGFLVKTPRARLAYFPDTAGLPLATAQRLEGVDWFLCDATFNGDNWYPHSHMSIEEAVKLGQQLQARNTLLTHLSIHYSLPATMYDLKTQLANFPNVGIAMDGMVIKL